MPPFAIYTILLLVQVAFSGWHILGKLALDDGCDPLIFALYREGSATLLMFLMAWWIDGIRCQCVLDARRLALPRKGHAAAAIGCGSVSTSRAVAVRMRVQAALIASYRLALCRRCSLHQNRALSRY